MKAFGERTERGLCTRKRYQLMLTLTVMMTLGIIWQQFLRSKRSVSVFYL